MARALALSQDRSGCPGRATGLLQGLGAIGAQSTQRPPRLILLMGKLRLGEDQALV